MLNHMFKYTTTRKIKRYEEHRTSHIGMWEKSFEMFSDLNNYIKAICVLIISRLHLFNVLFIKYNYF